MTRGDLKTSRTGSRSPFQILADYYQTADSHDRDLWRKYSRATRCLAAVRWSRGLRGATLGPGKGIEISDAELAAEEVNGSIVAVLDLADWLRIRTTGAGQSVLVAAEKGRSNSHSPAG